LDNPGIGLPPARHLRDLSAEQWKSGLAAWLGWLFDGLDMHLYTLVAAPVVAMLLNTTTSDPQVISRSSWINAAFLVGWALGGGFFGVLGDRLGRSRTLGLTILTYAACTGLSFFARTWWQLLIFRFVAALGIGGEWAVGSALLAETWPPRWRPLAAACLQTAVNIGVLIACGVAFVLAKHPQAVFLAGILPALVVVWIRHSVPEPAEWLAAQSRPREAPPAVADLFRGSIRGLTFRTVIVCACSLSAWWAFMFWLPQHMVRLPDVATWPEVARRRLATEAFFILIGTSIAGNFFASALAHFFGYRRAIAMMFLGFFLAMAGTFIVPRGHVSMLLWVPWVGFFSGVFGLFTMYLPPLFPTLLRTTGAGFSYNIGRLAAALVTVLSGVVVNIGDFRHALLFTSLLFIPAMAVAMTLPDVEKAG
jgi:MFS family permease